MRATLSFALVVLSVLVATSGCGGGSSTPAPPPTITSITVSPNNVTVAEGQTQQFTAQVQGSGSFSSSVQWSVAASQGTGSAGSISSSGLYSAPAQLAGPMTVVVTAVSSADPTKSGSTQVNLVAGLISSITISPSGQNIVAGSSLTLLPQINGTGNFNPQVIWSVDGVVGGNSTFGTVGTGPAPNYVAPNAIPNPSTVTVKATSVQDPTKFGTAQLTIIPPPLGVISVSVTPTIVNMPDNQSQQFQVSVLGVGTFNSGVSWTITPVGVSNVPTGAITPNGLYTPPSNLPSGTTFNLTAASVADPSKTATVSATVHPPPVIMQLVPSSGNVGDAISISGANLDGLVTAQFAGPNRIPIQYVQYGGNDVGTSVNVPHLAMSGDFTVTAQWPGFQPVTSNALTFTRIPRLRIRAGKRDLSSGESTQMQYRVLGQPDARAINWSTDLGSIDANGLYVAPAVSTDSFTHVTGCIAGTQICQTEVLGLHSFRVIPYPAAVPRNQSLQLEAEEGGNSVSGTWAQLAGGGTLTAAGNFTAGGDLPGSGPVPINVTVGSITKPDVIAVTGVVPGVVSEISDYIGYGQNSSLGTFNLQVATAGARLYALANYGGVLDQSYFWIDVYDITDPIHPVWIDAVESAADSRMETYQNYLYQILTADESEGALWPGIIASFDISGNTPMLVDRKLTPTLVAPPASFSYSNGIFHVWTGYSYDSDTLNDSEYDLRSGNIRRKDFTLPLPDGANALTGFSVYPVGTDTRLYFFNSPTSGATIPTSYNLDSYDLTTATPTRLQRQSTPAAGGTIAGNYLIAGGIVFDISSGLPVQVSTFPAVADIQFPPQLPFNGKQLLLGTGQQGYTVEDISDVAHPKEAAVLFDGTGLGNNGTWAGQYAIVAGGGLRIYDAGPVGGGLEKEELFGPYDDSVTYDQLIYQSHLFTASAKNPEISSTPGVVTATDLSVNPPATLGIFPTGSQQPLAVQAKNSTLYVGTDQSLLLLDISNPSSMSQTASLTGGIVSLASYGNYLYAGSVSAQLLVFDISQATSPNPINSLTLPANAAFLRTSGSNLFVADDAGGMLIYSLAAPGAPSLISRYQGPTVADVAIDGTLALLGTAEQGLVILDISNLAAPTVVGQANLPLILGYNGNAAAGAVAVSNKIAYVGTWFDGATIFGFDYQTPAHPRLVSVMPEGGFLCDVVLSLRTNSTDLFVGGFVDNLTGDYFSDVLDITQPRNVMQLYPPFSAFGSNNLGNNVSVCTDSSTTLGAAGLAVRKRPIARLKETLRR